MQHTILSYLVVEPREKSSKRLPLRPPGVELGEMAKDLISSNSDLKVYVFVMWFVWMISGTTFYALGDGLGWARGLYMCVNVGYSIGWGMPLDPNDDRMWYSVFHILVGATMVNLVLFIFASQLIEDQAVW